MNRLNRKLTVGAVGAAAALAGTGMIAPAASAASTPGDTLAAIKAAAAAAVSVRESALQAAVTDVSLNPFLTGADRATILSVLTGDEPALDDLGAQIQADTTVSQARAGYQMIFSTYRVFALRLPQARFAESSDDLTGTLVPRLSDAEARLQILLAGPDSGQDTPTVQAEMADLAHQLQLVSVNTAGVPASVLAITPAQWDANPQILEPYRTELQVARAAAHQADSDVAAVVKALEP
jgi:hypothetical protein